MFIAKSEQRDNSFAVHMPDAIDNEGRTMASMRAAVAEAAIAQAPAITKERVQAPTANPQVQPTAEPAEFTDLYHQYFPKVFAYVYGRVQDKEISLDIVSDVFEKAFIKMRSLRSPESFGSWLFTIARNEVSSHWRKTKPAAKAAQEAAWENELHAHPKGPEETVLHKERLAALSQMVKQLPRREQEIIALKFDDGPPAEARVHQGRIVRRKEIRPLSRRTGSGRTGDREGPACRRVP